MGGCGKGEGIQGRVWEGGGCIVEGVGRGRAHRGGCGKGGGQVMGRV